MVQHVLSERNFAQQLEHYTLHYTFIMKCSVLEKPKHYSQWYYIGVNAKCYSDQLITLSEKKKSINFDHPAAIHKIKLLHGNKATIEKEKIILSLGK